MATLFIFLAAPLLSSSVLPAAPSLSPWTSFLTPFLHWPSWVTHNIGDLFAAMNLFAWSQALLLWCAAHLAPLRSVFTACPPDTATFHPVYDFFMGSTRNPRFFRPKFRPKSNSNLNSNPWFDLKFFCESRPGLILWVVLNAGFAFAQYEEQGYVTCSMVLVNVFQLWYILDYFWQEDCILTTMDIMHDPFGWMLSFGDLAWVRN